MVQENIIKNKKPWPWAIYQPQVEMHPSKHRAWGNQPIRQKGVQATIMLIESRTPMMYQKTTCILTTLSTKTHNSPPKKKRGLSLTLGTPVVLGLGHQFQIMDRCVAIKILKNLGVFFSRLIILWSSFGQGTFYMGSSNPELSSRSWGKSEKLDSGDMISGMTLLDCHVSYIYYHLLVYFTHRCFPYRWLHLKHL